MFSINVVKLFIYLNVIFVFKANILFLSSEILFLFYWGGGGGPNH